MKQMEELQKIIGYAFKNTEYLQEALTHSSYANEMKINKKRDYERLEFLGDAVLELVSSEFLFHEYKELPEGKLTKMRAASVCEPALAFCAREMKLEQFILLGKGEENTGGRNRDSIISDVLEATIGAVYLDGGLECARDYIHRFVLNDLENKQLFYDAKTVLQEKIQERNTARLSYELIREEGPEHSKKFVVRAMLDEEEIGTGEGRSKKQAEQKAAYQALLKMKNENPDIF